MSQQTVRERFDEAIAACVKQGATPTQCVLSLTLARRAAQEHDKALGPMFQSWHPTMTFTVSTDAPPNTLYVYAGEPPELDP